MLTEAAYLIWLDPSSSEFKKVNGQFTKSWCKKKGICPTVFSILGIINPAVEDTLSAYRQTLPRGHSSTEMYFHGTHLDCKLFLDEFHTLCTGHSCGICSISRSGFLPEEIRRDRFQRFGHAFYLAPNSSKSNDYCTKQCNVRYTAMLLCEVAPGKKHILRTNMTSLREPPNGYNSVYGKSKFLFFAGDLNYDEIVIFKPEAICPRYVLLYRWTFYQWISLRCVNWAMIMSYHAPSVCRFNNWRRAPSKLWCNTLIALATTRTQTPVCTDQQKWFSMRGVHHAGLIVLPCGCDRKIGDDNGRNEAVRCQVRLVSPKKTAPRGLRAD